MKEIFLLKLGEIVLKGANKRQFENRLRQNVRHRMKPYGDFDVYIMQSTVYVEPMNESADVDGAWEACRSIFGVVRRCRCRPCEKCRWASRLRWSQSLRLTAGKSSYLFMFR